MSEDTTSTIILFVFLCYIVGGLFRELNRRFSIPYTPSLLIMGLIWGSTATYTEGFGQIAADVSEINAHEILLIFIPALVFESSFGTDWHTFRRELWQVLILAGPGVIFSMAVTAVIIKYCLDYDSEFDWANSLMLGSVLAATDPVAVVALLKEVGASQRLATLIEGESLLNDGTAMVAFTVMLRIAQGEDMGFGDILLLFIRMSFGGPLVGLAFGIIMAIWMKRVFRDDILEVSLTFFTVYLLFFTAEGTTLHVSGILALVAYGLYMSAWGKTTITVENVEAVHHFWQFIAYSGETMIFILSGIIIGVMIHDGDFEGVDWLKLLGLYFFLTLVRFIMILLSYPIIKRMGYGISWRQIVLMTHAGLRGAVGLSLALIVSIEKDLDERVRTLSLFLTAGIAVITLLVNAPTTGLLIDKLGLAKSSKVQEQILSTIVDSILDNTDNVIQNLKLKQYLAASDWFRVEKFVKPKKFAEFVLKQTSGGRDLKRMMRKSGQLMNFFDEFKKSHVNLSYDELLIETRHRYLTALKGRYWHEYEQGQCTALSLFRLFEATDICLDDDTKPMRDWEILQKSVFNSFFLRIGSCVREVPCIGQFYMKSLYHSLSHAYDIASTFIQVHEHAFGAIQDLIERENLSLSQDTIFREAEVQIKICRAFIQSNISENFSEINRDVQTRKAAHAVLNKQIQAVTSFYRDGMINKKEFNNMKSFIEDRVGQLLIESHFSKPPDVKEVIPKIQFFESFSSDDLKVILNHTQTLFFQKGDYIFKKFDTKQGLHIVLRGLVQESLKDEIVQFKYSHDSCSVIGYHHLLETTMYTTTDCKAKTVVCTAYISKDVFEKVDAQSKYKERIWLYASPILIKLNQERFNEYLQDMEFDKLRQLISLCKIASYEIGDTFTCQYGGILLNGTIQDTSNFRMLRKGNRKLSSLETVRYDSKLTSSNSLKKSNSMLFSGQRIAAIASIKSNPSAEYSVLDQTQAIVLHYGQELGQYKEENYGVAIDQILLQRTNTLTVKSSLWSSLRPGGNTQAQKSNKFSQRLRQINQKPKKHQKHKKESSDQSIVEEEESLKPDDSDQGQTSSQNNQDSSSSSYSQ